MVELVHYVTEQSCSGDWLKLLDQELNYLMALTRLTAEKRKEEATEGKGLADGN